MSTLYTPPAGNNTYSVQQQTFQDALDAITGSAPSMDPQVAGASAAVSSLQRSQPTYTAQANQANFNASGLPQLQDSSSNLGKLFQMYLADTGFAGKYTNPSLTQPGSTLPNPITTTGSPSITPASGGGFAGFTTPGAVTAAMGGQSNAVTDAMNTIKSAMDTEQGVIKDQAGTNSENYQAALNAATGIANITATAKQQDFNNKLELMKLQSTGVKFNLPQANSAVTNFFTQNKQGKYVSPDVYQQAKEQYVGAGGDAITFDKNFYIYRDPSHPDEYPVDPQAITPAETKAINDWKSQLTGAYQILSTAQSMRDNLSKVPGPLQWVDRLSGGGIAFGVPDIAAANAKFFDSLNALRTGSIGGRITQNEIGWLQNNALPREGDSIDVMNAKISAMQDELNFKISNPTYTFTEQDLKDKIQNHLGGGNTSGSSQWEVVQ